MEPERRVEAMRNLGDLKLAMGGRAKEGNFGDWDVIGVSLRAISMPNLILHSTFFLSVSSTEGEEREIQWHYRKR